VHYAVVQQDSKITFLHFLPTMHKGTYTHLFLFIYLYSGKLMTFEIFTIQQQILQNSRNVERAFGTLMCDLKVQEMADKNRQITTCEIPTFSDVNTN
jgi:hypothetical protein